MNKSKMNFRSALSAAVLLLGIAASGLRAQIPAAPASLDQILKEISTFDGGIDSAAFWKLREYVYARKDNASARAECEARLLDFLATNATPVAKMAVCRHLRVIGSDKSIPVLQNMLLAQATADMALYALQKLPGNAVDKALIQTIPKVEGPTKISLLAALGERKCVEAIAVLGPMLAAHGEYAGAAALALGEIGGESATDNLLRAMTESPADLKATIASAALRSAEGSVAAKNLRAAAPVYDRILAEKSLPVPIRSAALIGKIATAGSQSADLVIAQLQGSDLDMQEAAIGKIKDVFSPEAIGKVTGLLSRVPEASQVKLIAVLATYPKDRVLSPLLKAAQGDSLQVRIAVYQALESVGDSSTVPFLLDTAAKTRGPEQIAARNALALIKGKPADDAVLGLLSQRSAEDVSAEILLTIAERRIYYAKSAVAASLLSPSPRIRIQALRTLRTIGTPSDIPTVLDYLLACGEDAEESEGTATIAALALKIANSDGRSNAVKDRLGATRDPKARVRLVRLLGRIGDDTSLPLLRAALTDANEETVDAAARALAAWPTSAARDDVIQLAQKARSETHRLLALQGLLRMVRSERYRRPEAAVADLRLVYAFSTRPEERRLILGLLPNFACPEALELAGTLLGESAVKAEAQAAIDKLKARLSGK
jgi:HEAT repeat protein